ncbi:thioredoxin [Rodentibacter trehalosifermentans]|uniref:Thioredoxin n=1 Tax=Rodentibacter trehalosifermentans TaxID=1908263 RepID=A0A1V3IQN9_9PAST|nr:TlpA disulfide reductase family protein [Rodentibacter trehalosifermentans]OOF44547.1 thioredoxin [Rodentibacter trehalosifermentans]OOF50845.1 thioredoxin [Rodentibacter trehalosifermentans]
MNVKALLKSLCISAVIFNTLSCKEEKATVGHIAPELAAYDLQGNPVSLKDWQGTRLLTFWSETCGHCMAELKAFEQLNAAYPNQVQLIAINVDGEKRDTNAVVAKHQLTQSVIKDQMNITAERYQLIGTPTSFIIDGKGYIQAKFEGKIGQETLDKLFKPH